MFTFATVFTVTKQEHQIQTMKRISLLISAFLLFLGNLHAQMMPQFPTIPNDTETRVGKLDNGLTYYLRHNEKPEHVADFYIAQRVGSLQEDDSQRGLAHFLEHMAFNGSRHFNGNGIIDFTRGLGVAFGKDLNAYTSIEQTVYRICNVPTQRQTALDSCLLILSDWSNGLSLLPEEIDKERGVIHGEWAMRNNAIQRLVERNLPQLFPGSKYGERLPIGLMAVVDSFQPQTLRAYYEKWYHPEHQAIIVIGDIDIDHTEKTIKELFGGIKAHDNAAHVEPVAVPDNDNMICIIDKDKEMQYTMLELDMKSDPMPREMRNTQFAYLFNYMTNMTCSMFNERMNELVREPDCPFLQLVMNYAPYIGVTTMKDAMTVECVPKEGKEKEALAAAVRELRRIKAYGFTAGEFLRAKENIMSQKEKAYSNRNKRKNDEFYGACLANYLNGNAMPDADTDYKQWQTISQMIPLEAINQMCAQAVSIDEDKNLVLICFAQEKDGAQYLTEADAKKVIADARAEKVEAWVDNAKDEPLIAEMPKAGKIVKEKKNDTFGYTELTLSNGARVCLKKTDFKDDEIILQGWAPGGSWQYGAADYSNLKIFENVVSTYGMGNFSNSELQKALAGKQCRLSIGLGNRYNNVNGNTTPKDAETLMQLLYLTFTAPQKDEKTYATLMNTLETVLKNRDLQPETAISDSLTKYLTCDNERFKQLQVSDLKNISADRCLEITREQFSDVSDYVFTIIGNFEEAEMQRLVCQYIGALPSKKNGKKNTADMRTLFSGDIQCDFDRKMETPKPYVALCFKGEAAHTLRNRILASFAGEVLQMQLLKEVREDAGAAYNIGASAYLDTEPEKSFALLRIGAPISTPEKVDTALLLIDKCVADMVRQADTDMVEKVRANLLKQADINARRNNTWQGIIETWYIYGLDVCTDYKKIVSEVTPEEVSAFLRDNILKYDNKLKVVMRPAK